MKADRSIFTVLLLVTAAVFQLPAQQNEADRKVPAEIRAGADKGDAKAQYELGRAFFSGTLGVAKDKAEAVKWFRKAAEQNVADAQFSLGACYANGQGVTKDDAEAVKWFRKAAEQNLAEDRKSTRLNSSHVRISYAVFCLKKKKNPYINKPLSNKHKNNKTK